MTTSTSRSHSPPRSWFIGTVLLCVAAIAAGGLLTLHGSKARAVEASGTPSAIAVTVANVIESPVSAWDDYSGRLEAVERVDIRPRVSGAILRVHFREGSLVKAGELLVTVDPAPYAAEVERTQAQLNAAEARLAHQVGEHRRAELLWQEQAIALRELDERIHGLREAEANVSAARASADAAKLNLEYTLVRAPISGRIGKIDVTVGNIVAAGPTSQVLTNLVSVNPIYASFDADEQVVLRALNDVPSVNGDRGRIDAIPVRMGTAASDGTPYEGKLQLIDNQVDARSGTIRVRARFDNSLGTLIPGQFAKIRLGRSQVKNVLLISERAIGTDQNKKFVLVLGTDNRLAYREITLGGNVGALRIVATGLKPNERIVVSGLQRVKPGTLVSPREASMTSQSEGAAS